MNDTNTALPLPKPGTLLQLIKNSKLVIIDFDETITEADSLHFVVECALNYHNRSIDELHQLIKVYTEAKQEQSPQLNTETRFDSFENEIEYQKRCKPIELSSSIEAFNLKIFHSVPKQEFINVSEKIIPKAGFLDFFKQVYGQVPILILSVNWSYTMIEAFFTKHGYAPNEEENKFFILTNDFEFDAETGLCTGAYPMQDEGIRTGYDKLLSTREWITKFNAKGRAVYIGDSETDVLSMLETKKSISIYRTKHSSYQILQNHFGKKLNQVLRKDDDDDEHEKESHFVIKDWTYI